MRARRTSANLRVSLLAIPLLIANSAFASILPPNDLYKEDGLFESESNISEELFNKLIDNAIAVYEPVFKTFEAEFHVKRLWDSSEVNAFAHQSGNKWYVDMHGGLARRPEVTPDGFTLVICHEIGHHLAGFPYHESFFGGTNWAASEGQSDYYATHVCATKLWAEEIEENAKYRTTVPETAKSYCDNGYATEQEQNLCYRTLAASHSLGTLLGAIGSTPTEVKFDTPDENVVTKTNFRHPKAQCRLDTYMAGAVCTASFNDGLIPGKGFTDGNSLEAEQESATVSCTAASQFSIGLRPGCWFAARL